MRGRAASAAVLAAAFIGGWAAPAAEAAASAAAVSSAEAQEARVVTLEEALRRASAVPRQEASLQRSIDGLRRQLDRASKQLGENSYIDYFTLYEKSQRNEPFDQAERDRFRHYNEMYYFMVMEMSERDRFNSFVAPRELTAAELTASIRKLEWQQRQIRPAAELALRELFHGIAGLKEQIELLEAKLELERLRLEQDPGRRTAAETRVLELEHETTALTKRTLTRSLAIAEAALKKELGIPFRSAVAIRSEEPAAPELQPLKRYEALALERRAEALSAALDEELKRRKAALAERYIADPEAEERKESRMEAEEAAAALAEARARIAEDVANAYAAAADRRYAWEQAEERAAQARSLQGIAERMAETGAGTSLAAKEAAWAAAEAEVRAKEAKRAYELAWHRLTAASGIGPGYAQGEEASMP
ncbi:hypothetical protein [Paenibacillus sp.]|uniref:hypothetical protein n=1 Tax=Paenibacillus sp. TaxID=58172 RepID=UPI002D29733D|nr:hypothetical protein [Paenibacillus sp.]HZG85644.1 hypothetical protein [Paenibacillus sp.]